MLKRDEAESIFKDLAIRITAQMLFQVQIAHLRDRLWIVANLYEYFSGFACVKLFQIAAPPQVADARHFIGVTGNSPTADVLASGCQKKLFRSFRIQAQDPFGQSLCVEQLLGMSHLVHRDEIRVPSVLFIETTPSLQKSRPVLPGCC